MAITLHTGAAEAVGTLRLLDADSLGPGEEGWAQVRLQTPIAALRGDRCVLRIPSPALTVAGGVIVAINPQRHRRFAPATTARLAALASATPEERLLDVLAAAPREGAALGRLADLPDAEAAHALAALRAAGAIVPLAPDAAVSAYWAAPSWLAAARETATAALDRYHARYPLRQGMAGEALREELGLERRAWGELLARWQAENLVTRLGDLVRLPRHSVILDEAQERAAAALHARLAAQPFAPPSGAELGALDPELLAALLERGDPVRLDEGILLTRAAYEEMRDSALALIDSEGQVTVGMLRDRFGTSRKFALALLEYLDDLRLTRRLGDGRVRGPAARSGTPHSR
jgi:selenocysteine-specific elongation factor